MRTFTIVFAVVVGSAGGGSGQTTEFALRPGSFEVGGLTADDRYVLSRVVGAQRLAGGQIVIADHHAQGLRLFTETGEFLAAVGGRGGGPEEFQSIRGVGYCERERVVAFDAQWTRKIYDNALNFVDSRTLSIPGLPRGAYQLACEQSGTMVVTGWGDSEVQHRVGLFEATAPVLLVRDDRVVHEFGDRLSSERVGSPPDLRGQTDRHYAGNPSGPHPFGRQTSVAIGTDRVYIGDGSDFEVEVYDLAGRRLPTIRWEGSNREITRQHLDTFESERVAAVRAERRPAIRRALQELPKLDRFPAYDALMVDRGERLWIRSFLRPGADEYRWTIFEEGGDLTGILRLSGNVRVLEAGRGYVLVVERDELEVETVRLMELVR